MNGCYHVFPKFTFWSRNNDGRGLGWRQLGLIPPILGSSMVIPPKSHQTKYLEVYYKTAERCRWRGWEYRYSDGDDHDDDADEDGDVYEDDYDNDDGDVYGDAHTPNDYTPN